MSIYIYPTYNPVRDKSGNLYIKYFHDAFKDQGYVISNNIGRAGIISIFANLSSSIFIINWVDLIPNKRFGKIQFAVFVVGLCLLKMLNKDVVWVLHNKRAHKGKSMLVSFGMSLMAKLSTVVITHSLEGVSFFDLTYPKYSGKCHYIPHPVYTNLIYPFKKEKWDYIIWGGINERKKVADFLEFISNREFYKSKKILICGRCNDSEYTKRIETACSANIVFENRFLSDEELKERISQSRCVLFTYSPDSVLSSGALIYTLNFCKPIIGPRVGSFEDLTDIVSCYNTFEDIEKIPLKENMHACSSYISSNTWLDFPHKVMALIKNT